MAQSQPVNLPVPKLRILLSDTHNPWFNLATEEWIFNDLHEDTQILFLWRNHDTVVIGRNQNPWSECNLTKMEADQVTLARRTSGGGAVFHDLGNTCFTFLSPKLGYDRNQNTQILLNALQKLGVTAEASGRNDLVISSQTLNLPGDDRLPRKISGSAFRENQKKAFHHGTFLIRTDLARLAEYLTPHPKKLQSKGRTSVRSRVMNISDLNPTMTHETVVEAMIAAFQEFHGAVAEREHLDHSVLKNIPELEIIFDRFASWEWRFGHAPQFSQTVSAYVTSGLFEIHFNLEQGVIADARVYSDSLYQDLIPSLERHLKYRAFTRSGIDAAIGEVRLEFPILGAELLELAAWLAREIEV